MQDAHTVSGAWPGGGGVAPPPISPQKQARLTVFTGRRSVRGPRGPRTAVLLQSPALQV